LDNIAISESIFFIESSSVGMEFLAGTVFGDNGENADWNVKGGKFVWKCTR
jgi:hypothetical protein